MPRRRLLRGSGLGDPWLLGLASAGLLLRVALALWLDAGMRPRGDEGVYLREALAFRQSGTLETGFHVRPPLYFLLVAGLGGLADLVGVSASLAVKLCQCAAGALVSLPVYRSARRVAGVRAARIAVAFLMFDPTLVAYTHLLWPETFFLLLVAVVFDASAGLERAPLRRRLGLGLAIGLAMLLKPAFGLFTLFLAGSWLWRLGPRRAAALALVVGGVAAVVISPWVIRNQLRYGPAIVMENQGPYNLWIGNDPGPPRRILEEWKAIGDPLARSRVGIERGLEAIARDPGAFARNFASRTINFWGLEWFVVRHAAIGGYGPLGRETFLWIFFVVQIGHALHLLAAAAGIRSVARDPTLKLLCGYAVVFTLMVSAMAVTTRFRVPFAFLTAIAAGAGVDRLLSRGLGRRDLVAVAAAVALLAASFWRPLFVTIATGDFEQVRELARWEWRFFRY